jgi:predicted protein tyrosine phosphatase
MEGNSRIMPARCRNGVSRSLSGARVACLLLEEHLNKKEKASQQKQFTAQHSTERSTKL